MATAIDRLTANVMRVETFKLKNGRIVVDAGLDVPYLRMMHFMKSLAASTAPIRRKQKKRKLPPGQPRRLVMHVITPNGSRIEVSGDLAFSHPLDAPASMSLHVQDAREVPVGSRLELTIFDGE